MNKLILDLCGGTGSWSRPYKEAGYDVRNITWPDYDVATYEPPKGVCGVLAAPPCTMFSFARTVAKKPRDLEGAMSVVYHCLRIIWRCQYDTSTTAKKTPLRFWALENPYHGLLKRFLGKPVFTFDPWEFGDAYKKKTALWGYFNAPKKRFSNIGDVLTAEQITKHKTNSQALPKFDLMESKDIAPDWFGTLSRKDRRAITPQGFAEAFFKANR